MTTSARNNSTFEAIRRSLAESLPKSGEAWLYGSRARGDAREDSDWDVLVVLDKERLEMADYMRVSYPLTMLGCDLGEEINPMLYTKADWQRYSFTPFYHNVAEEGIRL